MISNVFRFFDVWDILESEPTVAHQCEGKSALHEASKYGHIDVMKILLAAGAVITPQMAPFDGAYQNETPELIALICKHGGNWTRPDPVEARRAERRQQTRQALAILAMILLFSFIYFVPNHSAHVSFNPYLTNSVLGRFCFWTFIVAVVTSVGAWIRLTCFRTSGWLDGILEFLVALGVSSLFTILFMLQHLPILCALGTLVFIGSGLHRKLVQQQELSMELLWPMLRRLFMGVIVLHLRVFVNKFI
eukprot:TRINITY_DN17367_c0_g1_i1.p1 TRINITY_DN17367_c0_g1~~TRINITY_DN17367_c0_g1_i1.p1  ORF type:complete len:248 (-),score=21.17 TRINITY_DN17367_c0_g1_i1:85-828(-)